MSPSAAAPLRRQRPTSALRALLGRPGVIVKPGAYDALSARIIEQAGFDCCGLSGYGVSVSTLGRPDVGLTTMNDVVTVCNRVASAVRIPVIADADTGYGNAINVLRTVEEFIKAGAAAIHIEDQESPKRCGHVAGKRIVSIDEACGKFRAAAKVRDELDPDFYLIARTDARGVKGGSVDAVIERANAYLEAGADMIFPDGLTSMEEVKRVCHAVRGPIHYLRTGVSPLLTMAELEDCGVRMVSNATGMLRVAARAMWDYMHDFRKRDIATVKEFFADVKDHPVGDFHGFMGFPEFMALEREFLPAADERYEGTLGYRHEGGKKA